MGRKHTIGSIALVLATSACAGGTPAEQAVAETGERLQEIQSGDMTLRMVVGPLEEGADDVGFEMTGVFQTGGDAPAAQLTYTQFVAGTEQTSTFTSVDGSAFVEVDGTSYELQDDAAGAIADIEAFNGLDLAAWMTEPQLVEGPDGIDRIESPLDPAVVLRDLLAMGARIGGDTGLPEIVPGEADQIRRAARDATGVLETGTDDRLLRQLSGRMDLVPDERFGLPGGRLEFLLAVDRPNEPVQVDAPADPRPISELPDQDG